MTHISRPLYKRLGVLAVVTGLALAAMLAFAPLQRALSQQSIVTAPGLTIEASGDASMTMETDQVTLALGKQTIVVNASDISEIQQRDSEKVVAAIRSAVNDNNSTTIVMGGSYLNPYFSGPMPTPRSNIYTAYITSPITIDPEDLAETAERIADAGFSVEGIYLASPSADTMSPFPLGTAYGEILPAIGPEGNESSSVTSNSTAYKITLNIAITSKPDTLQNVVKQYEELSERLNNLQKELGITDGAQPPNANFFPSYDGGIGQNPSGQYSSHIQIVVKTDPSNVDEIIQAAGNEGAYLENLYGSFSDDAIDKARVELNQKALESAKARANEMGAPLGLEAQAVKSIKIDGNALFGTPSYRGVGLLSSFPYYGTPSQQLSVTVTAEFEMG
jgi:uncharacterized protein YggE